MEPEHSPTTPPEQIIVTGEPVTVTAEMVRRFAAAVGSPEHEVPATFAAALTADVQRAVMHHPRLVIDLSRTLHTAQGSQHHRPISIGETLSATATVTGVRQARGGRIISFDTVLQDSNATVVHTLTTTLLTSAADTGDAQDLDCTTRTHSEGAKQ